MSAQPDFPIELLSETLALRMRVGEALCAAAESLAMAGKIRRARRALAAVQKIVNDTAQLAVPSPADSTAARDLRGSLDELQHRTRNAETVLKLLE